MRILAFRGNFSWDGEKFHEGLICFCHFHQSDDEKTIQVAKERIEARLLPFVGGGGYIQAPTTETAVLVPFSCLDKKDTTPSFLGAHDLFKKLGESIPDSVSMPFASSKEIHLNVMDNGSYVQFIEVMENDSALTPISPYVSQ
jgi:hypothetical protein